MSSRPTPPAQVPEPNRLDNVSPVVDGHSAYWGLDAQETSAAYVRRVRSIKAQAIALILANLVAMIWFIEEGHFALCPVGFILLFAITLIARVCMGALFLKLGEVVSQDCDPARYRAVLDVLSAEIASVAPRTPSPSSSRTATTSSSIALRPCAASNPSPSSAKTMSDGSVPCRSSF